MHALNPLGPGTSFVLLTSIPFVNQFSKHALSYYCTALNNASPFPSQLKDHDTATDAWVQTCTNLNTQVDFEELLMKLVLLMLLHSPPLLRLTLPQITSHAAQAYGHLKTVAQPLVETLYWLGNGKCAT
jgi:hypothetical protein